MMLDRIVRTEDAECRDVNSDTPYICRCVTIYKIFNEVGSYSATLNDNVVIVTFSLRGYNM